MNKKQKAALNNLLDEVPWFIEVYNDPDLSERETKYIAAVDIALELIEAFTDVKEAREVVELIEELEELLDNLSTEQNLSNSIKGEGKIFKYGMERAANLKKKIENI